MTAANLCLEAVYCTSMSKSMTRQVYNLQIFVVRSMKTPQIIITISNSKCERIEKKMKRCEINILQNCLSTLPNGP